VRHFPHFYYLTILTVNKMEQFACCTLILCPQNLEEGNNSGIDVSTVEGLQCHIYISHISKTKTACCDVL
jgi:hypothetical protein